MFEAGTPHIAGAIGLGATLRYITSVPLLEIQEYERQLGDVVREQLMKNKHIRFLSPPKSEFRTGIITFMHDKIHPHDLSAVLAKSNVCIRAGHHCAMPLHQNLGVIASARVSLYVYNNERDIEKLLEGISQAEKVFL